MVTLPKTILFLAANPLRLQPLQLGDECRAIEDKIRAAKFRDQVSFRSRWAARPDDLLQALNEDAPTVLHFSGHGTGDQGICFQSEDGSVFSVSATGLTQVMCTAGSGVTLVVLNACYSHVQAQALIAHVPCVIGMTGAISDEAARIYAASLYRALAFGKSVGNAHRQGLAALALQPPPRSPVRDVQGGEDTRYSLKPTLLTRADIDADHVFIVEPWTDEAPELHGEHRQAEPGRHRVGSSLSAAARCPRPEDDRASLILRSDGAVAQRRSTVKSTEGEPRFTGRNRELRAIAGLFRVQPIVVLHGMPGIGKTRLAMEYAREHSMAYPGGMFFLCFEQSPSVELSNLLRVMGKPLHIDESLEDRRRRALQDLGSAGRALLIYDAVADERTLREWLPYGGLDWHLLVTSTFAHWAASWGTVEVGALREPAARVLVAAILSNEAESARLAGPIAARAAGITTELCATATEIRARLRRGERVEKLRDGLAPETTASFAVAWALLPRNAQIVLGALSSFPQRSVSQPILLSLLHQIGWHTNELQTALDEARARSLITQEAARIDVHERIARFAQDHAPPVERLPEREGLVVVAGAAAKRRTNRELESAQATALLPDGQSCEMHQGESSEAARLTTRPGRPIATSGPAEVMPVPSSKRPHRHRRASRLPSALSLAAAAVFSAFVASVDSPASSDRFAVTRSLSVATPGRSFVRLASVQRRGGHGKPEDQRLSEADALQFFGEAAFTEGRLDEAADALERARDLHQALNRRAEVGADLQALAEIHANRGQFAEALRALSDCIGESQAAADRLVEGYCHVSSAQVLTRVGYFSASEREIERAEPLLTSQADRAWIWTARGQLLQAGAHQRVSQSNYRSSIAAFETARRLASSQQQPELLLTNELNLAYSLVEAGRPGEAARHLEQAQILDIENVHATGREQIRARIAFQLGDLKLASALNDDVYKRAGSDDERLEVCTIQARIALASNHFDQAEYWARRGIVQAEKIREAQTVLELRRWILSIRRSPYELLFTALARAGKYDAALAVFDQWHRRTLLDAVWRRHSVDPADLHRTARQLGSIGPWFPEASIAPLMPTDNAALPALDLHAVDLFALAIADGQLWSITARRGKLQMEDLGPYQTLQARIDQFVQKPTDRELGDELGATLLRNHVHRTTRDTLRVVLDEPLAGLPVAALRLHGTPLIAARPIVYAPRLSELTCVPAREGARRAVVLADPAGDLPEARREAARVASLFGTTSATGPAASSQALFSADGSDVLHIAVHGEIGANGGLLSLSDRYVSAFEIAARGPGPSLVVVSACSSARSNDMEEGGALSTAFLAAGSRQVLATLRPISDFGARELTIWFYERGGVHDPARALARVQASLADTDNMEWPSFAVFGYDVCKNEP